MRKPQVSQKINLSIHNLGSNGEGVGYWHGYTVFVDGALPGEVIEAEVFQAKKSYGRARLLAVVEKSPDRVKPPCPVFDRCGGCQLMHLAYQKQLSVKRQRVVDAFERIGKMQDVPIEECLPSPSPLFYRNKIQLPVRQGQECMQIGLYARNSHDLVEIEGCFIHCELGEKIFSKVCAIVRDAGIIPYNPVKGEGELRHILIKTAVNTGHVLVVLVTNGANLPSIQKAAKEIVACCPEVQGVAESVNTGRDNTVLGKTFKVLEGSLFIEETLCGLTFNISPASFFQVNPQQAERLYRKAMEFARLSGDDVVLDAFCGVGTLSLIMAEKAKNVLGVECVPEAIVDARKNASRNHIHNATFVCDVAESAIKDLQGIDVVFLNPPRKGCELSLLEGIRRLQPRCIVYISCDPATLARDLAHLQSFGFTIEAVQPYDMFPQTAHVECVVKLTSGG